MGQWPRGDAPQRAAVGNAGNHAASGRTVPSNVGNRTAGATGNGNTSTKLARNGNTGVVGTANTNSGTINRRNGNTGVVGSGNGNVANNANVNNGNIGSGNINTGNVVAGNNVNVDVNGGWSGYPAGTGAAYATGVAVGATATAAAVGSAYYALPNGCSPSAWNNYSYYYCGGAWYQQRYEGGSSVYVVVSGPTTGK